MKSSDVLAALRVHYPVAQFALLEQVGNGTGYYANRHADALVMSLWPSRGLDIFGIEVKVSRSDWKRELEKPDKAEPVARYCDFWNVAAPAGTIDPLTLPEPWGLLEVHGKGDGLVIRIAKKAERLEAQPLDRVFLAAVLRQAQQSNPTLDMLRDAKADAWEKVQPDIETAVNGRTSLLNSQLETLRQRVHDFEAVTGIPLESHPRAFYGFGDAASLGRAVTFLADGKQEDAVRRLQMAARSLQEAMDAIAKGERALTQQDGS